MKINIENLQKLVRIHYSDDEKLITTTNEELIIDENGKTVSRKKTSTSRPREESIDTVKYDTFNKLLDIVLYPPPLDIEQDDTDEQWKKKDDNISQEKMSYDIAYNTLLKYKIIE